MNEISGWKNISVCNLNVFAIKLVKLKNINFTCFFFFFLMEKGDHKDKNAHGQWKPQWRPLLTSCSSPLLIVELWHFMYFLSTQRQLIYIDFNSQVDKLFNTLIFHLSDIFFSIFVVFNFNVPPEPILIIITYTLALCRNTPQFFILRLLFLITLFT